MTQLATLDLFKYHTPGAARTEFLEQLDQVCRKTGFFYLTNHGISPTLQQQTLACSRAFFDQEQAEKNRVHIRHSDHYRGYSQMKNERDWREQIHFGQELPSIPVAEHPESCYRLTGPNQWPETLGLNFRQTMLLWMQEMDRVGQQLLRAMAECCRLPIHYFEQLSAAPPYLLMKLICYYAQPNAMADRPGVAAHCDWSWMTLLLQDDVGGLEVLSPEGEWLAVNPAAGAISVNLGELMEIITQGQYVATAHRVINPSEATRRISVPVFINPALDARIVPVGMAAAPSYFQAKEHIHRVVEQGVRVEPFTFGSSEWERKGLGKWCHRTACLDH